MKRVLLGIVIGVICCNGVQTAFADSTSERFLLLISLKQVLIDRQITLVAEW